MTDRLHPAEPFGRDPVRAVPARCTCDVQALDERCDLHGRAAQPDVWERLDVLDRDIALASRVDDEDDGSCPNCGARDSDVKPDRVTCRRCGTEAMPHA